MKIKQMYSMGGSRQIPCNDLIKNLMKLETEISSCGRYEVALVEATTQGWLVAIIDQNGAKVAAALHQYLYELKVEFYDYLIQLRKGEYFPEAIYSSIEANIDKLGYSLVCWKHLEDGDTYAYRYQLVNAGKCYRIFHSLMELILFQKVMSFPVMFKSYSSIYEYPTFMKGFVKLKGWVIVSDVRYGQDYYYVFTQKEPRVCLVKHASRIELKEFLEISFKAEINV